MYQEALPHEDRLPSTSHNSGYMVPLRFTQIFASLRSAKTSYSRGTLAFIVKKTQKRKWYFKV